MSKEVRFTVSDENWSEINAYVKAKKKWKRMSDFARYATFQTMEYSKVGGHRKAFADPSAPRVVGIVGAGS